MADIVEKLALDPLHIFDLSSDSKSVAHFNTVTKSLLDPIAKKYSVLDEIHIDGLDSTQVFAQAQMVWLGAGELLLYDVIPKLKLEGGEDEDDEQEVSGDDDENDNESDASEQEAIGEDHSEDSEGLQNEAGPDDALSAESGNEDGDEDSDGLSDADTKVPSDNESEPYKKDAFGLNDEFFDIDKFNQQILALEEDNLDNDDDEEIDLFADVDDDESEDEMEYYNEFFDKPGQQKVTPKAQKKQLMSESEDDGELQDEEYEAAVDSALLDIYETEEKPEKKNKSDKNLSSFEKQQLHLQAEISKLEAELVADKKWTMKGEVRSGDRPADSLLDDDESHNLEFDRTSKPVPVITDQVTESIEEVIKRRIRNDEFDDLPRRLITDVARFVKKQKAEVSDQKSSKSLADIYEDEFHGVDPNQKLLDQVQGAYDEITDLFTKLNYKLDSLCLAHYIPKPHEFKSIEIKVGENAAASISMEDAQPLHVTDEQKLAPQEVYKIGDDKKDADGARGRPEVQLKSGLAFSKDELTSEDKQRLHRARKRAKSKHFNDLKNTKPKQKEQQQDPKRRKVESVMGDLARSKNVTVIDRKGEMRDAAGKLKKAQGAKDSSSFRL